MAVDEKLRAIVEGFVTEAQETVEIVTRRLLELEGGDAHEGSWEEAARGLHTLKGAAGSLGMDDLARLAHTMEDLLAPYRAAKARLSAASVDALLKGLDAFVAGVRATADSTAMVDLAPVLANIAAQIPAHLVPEPAPVSLPAETLGRAGDPVIRDVAWPERGWRVQPRDVLALVREVDRLREVRLRLDERRRDVAAMDAATGDRPSIGPGSLFALKRALASEAEEVAHIVLAIEDCVRNLGEQPVRTILEPLRRLVRDDCRITGKLARLSVVGEDISLDRNVLQGLRESLVHMIRNAIDHGLELPLDRERLGKHREGALVLRVEQHGNVLYVEFSDDGAGLAMERLRRLAVERGLVQAEHAAALEPSSLSRLIFGSGLSTSASVTQTSGRGVGLDVVRVWVESLRGHVDVHSVAGQGTRFAFTLPVELGSSPLLVVRAGDQHLGVPLAAVERVVSATEDSVVHGRAGAELQLGDRRIALHDLGTALELRQPGFPTPGQPVVVIQSQGARCAVAVDEVIGDLDLVIRALPRELADIAAFQGAATTSRGELLLVLRPTWLQSTTAMGAPASTSRRALVVDDSMTARALHRAMLEAGGYAVHAVSSATQALEWMLRGRYEVIVCDVAMTPMDGVTFTGVVRAHPELRDTPIVLVSAREEVGLRARGLEAGADAFLSKADCAEGRLLALVSSVVARRGADA